MPIRKHLSALIVLCFSAGIVGLPAVQAEENRYGSWQEGGAGGDVQQLVEELRKLVDEAERARAADPRLLRDLRALAGRYDRPWPVELLRDDFADGDFTRSPAWSVTSGSFRVEPGWGLLSDVEATQPVTGNDTGSGKKKDLAAALITGLLSQYAQQGQQAQPQQVAPVLTPAQIETRARISNAFSLETVLSSEAGSKRIEFAVFQRSSSGASYVLAFSPNDPTPVTLMRSGSRGVTVIDSYRRPLQSADLGRQQLTWTRSRDGQMVVSIDGQELIRTVDGSLRDPFDGLAIRNLGGRFLVREISVTGQR